MSCFLCALVISNLHFDAHEARAAWHIQLASATLLRRRQILIFFFALQIMCSFGRRCRSRVYTPQHTGQAIRPSTHTICECPCLVCALCASVAACVMCGLMCACASGVSRIRVCERKLVARQSLIVFVAVVLCLFVFLRRFGDVAFPGFRLPTIRFRRMSLDPSSE